MAGGYRCGVGHRRCALSRAGSPIPCGDDRSGQERERRDVDRMEDRLYITASRDSARKMSAFWVLLVLAAIIASAGVVADSTATVIGAMIVAPLMTPILGTALALVLADRRHLLHNVGLVLAGSARRGVDRLPHRGDARSGGGGCHELPGRRPCQPQADRPDSGPGHRRRGGLRAGPLRRVRHAAGRGHRDLAGPAAGRRGPDPRVGRPGRGPGCPPAVLDQRRGDHRDRDVRAAVLPAAPCSRGVGPADRRHVQAHDRRRGRGRRAHRPAAGMGHRSWRPTSSRS